jgi:hypothetical protein
MEEYETDRDSCMQLLGRIKERRRELDEVCQARWREDNIGFDEWTAWSIVEQKFLNNKNEQELEEFIAKWRCPTHRKQLKKELHDIRRRTLLQLMKERDAK